MNSTFDRARKIIVEHLGVDEAKVTEEADLRENLGADSLDHVELVMAFEEEFGIEISDQVAETVTTVGQAVAVINELLTAKAA